jgi:hypothetical protein
MARSWTHRDNGRWCEIRLAHHLLGTVVVEARWGGRINAGSRTRRYPVRSRKEAARLVRMLKARRRRHDYRAVLLVPEHREHF